jgi:enoyl-CoA hydratase/carnithine racemase
MSEGLVTTDRVGAVAVVRLNHGVTNPLTPELVSQLANALAAVDADPSVRGIVLGSAGDKFFSIGLALPMLIGLPRETFGEFLRRFNSLCRELFTSRKPTVASITGHATAGGCILALCCDYRFMAEGRKLIGVNELKLGIPVPLFAQTILCQLVGWRQARDIVDSAEFLPADAALRVGLVDRALPLSEVTSSAVEWAAKLAAYPGEGYSEAKDYRTRAVLDQVRPHAEEADRRFLDLWYSPEVQERLREAAAKF